EVILEAGTHPIWLCLNTDYRKFFQTGLLELAEMGADGIDFDYIHMPGWLGRPRYIKTCYCQTCRKKFEKIYGRKMPEKVKQDDHEARLLVEFYNRTLIETFGEWVKAVNQRKPDCVMIVSCTFIPGMHSPVMSSRLAAVANAPKTEWRLSSIWPRNVPEDVLKPADDMRWAAGFTYLRGACGDRSPHVWLYPLWAKEEALSAASACMTYGLVANIDVAEDKIPNMTYAPAYELGKKVSPYLKRTKPMRWVAIHYDEHLRDQLWPDEEKIWKQALWPAYGPFEALCRARLPVAYVNDWQLEAGQLDGYKVLVLPHPKHLNASQQQQVAKFKNAGGVVISIRPDARFHDPEQHDYWVKKLLEQYRLLVPESPIEVAGGPEDLHAVIWNKRDGSATTVCLLNQFRWFSLHGRHRKKAKDHPEMFSTPPPPAKNVAVTLRSERTPKKVFEAVTGKVLQPTKTKDGWQIDTPDFRYMSAIVFEW
ncbi:MAG: hypothetical protein ACYTF1_21520, partial [Planctomycetota bacterium]